MGSAPCPLNLVRQRFAELVPFLQARPCSFLLSTDGFWLLLKPLSAGRHTLKFGGKYNRQSADYGHMVQDIEYVLLVQ